MNDCPNCPGGENHRHEYNPNPAIREIQLTEEGVWLIPRPVYPEEICVDDLKNLTTQLAVDESPNADGLPMVWNPERCRLEPGCWPDSIKVEWDSTETLEPPATDEDGNSYCQMSCGTGQVVAYEDLATGCISHLCVGGEIICLPKSIEEEGTPIDIVCYDVGSWDFPASYGGSGGDWLIFGDDYNNRACSPGPSQFAFLDKEFACWGDFGGSPGPDDGWNSLGWESPDPFEADPMIARAVDTTSHGCGRPAFRMDARFPVGTTGPITWSFNFVETSGATTFAAYDKISGDQLPVSILSEPVGSNAQVVNGPNGQQVFTNSTATGNYVLGFTPPPGVLLENVAFLIWNLAGVGGDPERVDTIALTAVPNTEDCCYTWNSVSDLVNWMNSTDPIQRAWTLNGTEICQSVGSGVGQNYGQLSSCSFSSPPSISSGTSTGGVGNGCPTCVTASQDPDTGEITINQNPGPTIKFTPGSTTEPCDPGRILPGDWPIDSRPSTFSRSPGPGGVVYDVRPGDDSEPDFYSALFAMGTTGGNGINFLLGRHEGEYRVRGGELVGGGSAPSGVAGNHNYITGELGHEIDSQGFGIDPSLAFPAIDIAAANHWDVVGLNIIGSAHYGIRLMLSQNTVGSKAKVIGNRITGTAHGGIKIRGWFEAINATPAPWGGEYWGGSYFVEADFNIIGGNRPLDTEPDEFREAVYVGAYPEWVDDSHDIWIRWNDLYEMDAELVEAKSGSYRVFVEENDLHDSVLVPGTLTTSIPVGHLVLHWWNSPPPAGHPGTNPDSHAIGNRVWNLSGANRWPIVLGGGAMTARANLGWGNEKDELIAVTHNSDAESYGDGLKVIHCNTNVGGGTYILDPENFGFPVNVDVSSNVPSNVSVDFIGPLDGTADAGEGPGSGLVPVASCTTGGNGCPDATNSCINECAGALCPDQRNECEDGAGGGGTTTVIQDRCCISYEMCSPSTERKYVVVVDTNNGVPIFGSETYYTVPELVSVPSGSLPNDLFDCYLGGPSTEVPGSGLRTFEGVLYDANDQVIAGGAGNAAINQRTTGE